VPCTVFTKYRIHWVLDLLSTASIQNRLSLSPSQSLISCLSSLISYFSSHRRLCFTQRSRFPQLGVDQCLQSQLPSHLPSNLTPPDSPPPSTCPNSIDHGLQVHPQNHSIMALIFASSWPTSLSPTSLNNSLQVYVHTHLILVCKCIFKLAWSWCGDMMELDARESIVHIFPPLQQHPVGIGEE